MLRLLRQIPIWDQLRQAFYARVFPLSKTAQLRNQITRFLQNEIPPLVLLASSSIPKQLHYRDLRLANEHTTNAAVRLQQPSAEFVLALVDNINSYFTLFLPQTMCLPHIWLQNHLFTTVCNLRKLLQIITNREMRKFGLHCTLYHILKQY
ncbi:hypothetical protein MTR_5g059865 [Medicago truncatula]|uniref:Uncharacterized protein n=1 Tax=Medicago truncatula TaxID=3880 RepID=A0A072UF21_MEDTR|nr:hypothetical protein MTR_5g059865 [Medicago truncatula]